MKDLELKEKKYDFAVPNLGKPKINSPIKMSTSVDDGLADYVREDK